MIVYQSRFLTRGEVWFDNRPDPVRVDWILYHQRSQPTQEGKWRPFYTHVIDLTQSPEALLSQMDGFTAADIRKAQKKDQTICRQLDSSNRGLLLEFSDFYDRFAALTNLGTVDRHWLERTAFAGQLDLWAADTPEGQRQAYHVFYRDSRRVRSVHLASLHSEALGKEAQRKIGRANRLLIWNSMLHYKNEGVRIFDLGGWYNGTADRKLLGVNKFKEGFGGKKVCEYEGERLVTFKAWSAVKIARLLDRLRERFSVPRALPPLGAGR